MFTRKWFVLAWSKILLKNSETWPVQVIDINEECKSKYYAECTKNLVESVNSKKWQFFLKKL